MYAAARNPDTVDLAGVKPIQLDVTDEASIATAADAAGGVSILVNNAGSSTRSSLLTGSIDDIRMEMDTHYFGSLLVTRAFAPQLAHADASTVLNILSVLAWISCPCERRILRREIGRLVDDQRPSSRARLAGDQSERSARRLHGH